MGVENRFSSLLLEWNDTQNSRSMPWKHEKDPYKIWLSEIILQQTRVEQGLAYYQRFTEAFPTIRDLARAPEDKVFKLWEGLGYYSRCRNLIATAQLITDQFNGKFPSTYNEILSLKGIGPYTAAAIASFAFDLPYAVLDGNVYRVLSRYTGSDVPIDSTAGKKYFTQLSESLLDRKRPAAWNQAIMDFGAVVCRPRNPDCLNCTLAEGCIAFQTGTTHQLPVKGKTLNRKTRWINYIVASLNGNVLIRKRNGRDIWKDLYEFIPVETDGPAEPREVLLKAPFPELRKLRPTQISELRKHQLSHQTLHIRLIHVELRKNPHPGPEWLLVPPAQLSEYAFPIILKNRL